MAQSTVDGVASKKLAKVTPVTVEATERVNESPKTFVPVIGSLPF